MKYRNLGHSKLLVSEICLGSMTWGTQNSQAEGHAQIDMALDHGVNFIDTAEMYPVNPVAAETIGRTEEIIGNWLASRKRRGDIVLATKVSGPGRPMIRDGGPLNAAALRDGVEASLKRLKTDYIDLFQLHWPERGTYAFRQNWAFDPSGQNRSSVADNMAEVAAELAEQVKAGRIRHFGLSNETAWGTLAWLRACAEAGAPRVISVQNEYSLLCRLYDTDMAEVSHHESVGLMAFSPLAAGLLSGKYGPDLTPPGSRRSFGPELGGRITPRVWAAIDAYADIARRHGLSLPQMANAWVLTRPFLGASIIGATTPDQLALALDAADLVLSPDVMADIAAAHKAHPQPY